MSTSLTYGQMVGYFNGPVFINAALNIIWPYVTVYGVAPDGSVYGYATISRTTSGSVSGPMQFLLTAGFSYPVKTVYVQHSSLQPIVIDLDYPVVTIGINIFTQVGV